MPKQQAARARPGRRPGPTATREAILEAARTAFAEQGYDRATVRGIAAAAGVDPRMVTHHFGSKQKLFLVVVDPPVRPAEEIGPLLASSDDPGLAVARFVVHLLETEEYWRVMAGVVRSATSDAETAALARELIMTRMLQPLARVLGADRPELRAALLGSQLVGLLMARRIVGVEPLASLPPDELVAAIAPTLRHYLVEPLDR